MVVDTTSYMFKQINDRKTGDWSLWDDALYMQKVWGWLGYIVSQFQFQPLYFTVCSHRKSSSAKTAESKWVMGVLPFLPLVCDLYLAEMTAVTFK